MSTSAKRTSAAKKRKTPTAKLPGGLTPQQEHLCQLITSGMPGMTYRQAYATAYGVTAETEEQWDLISRACVLARRTPAVVERVRELNAARAARMLETVNRVLEEQAHIAFSNAQDLIDDKGNLIGINDLPRHVAAAISSIEVDEYGKTKVKFWDKNAACTTLLKAAGAFEKDNRQKGSAAVEALVEALRGKVVGVGGIDIGDHG
jgi:hypothetical protein